MDWMSRAHKSICVIVRYSMLDFWIRVKDSLDYLGISQKELAGKIHESYNTLQSWISKDRLPDAEQAVKIARELQTSVEFLVTGNSVRVQSVYTRTIHILENAIKELKSEK